MRLSFKHMSRNNKLNKSDIAIIWKDIAIMWKDIIWIIRLVLRAICCALEKAKPTPSPTLLSLDQEGVITQTILFSFLAFESQNCCFCFF